MMIHEKPPLSLKEFFRPKLFYLMLRNLQIDNCMSEEVRIGKRYTLVVPKAIREELEIEEGQRVLMEVQEGKISIEPLPRDPFAVLEEVVGEPYDESKEEARAERWLKEHAGS